MPRRGSLRAGINYGNFLLVAPNPAGGEPRGIAPDIARELARRLDVPLQFVGYDAAGKLAEGVRARAWDIAFLGAEPERANEIAFSAPYLEIEASFLVPAGSPLKTIEDIDREGVRIAVAEKSAYDLYLRRNIKRAKLVHAQGIQGSYDLFVREELDALAGLKQRLLSDVETLPGARILDGAFTKVQQAIGTPKARAQAAAYVRAFVEDIKASGFVATAIARNRVKGVSVAPAS